jgi:hypothetical protein
MNGGGRACQIVNFIHFNKKGLGYIMSEHLKERIIQKMKDIVFPSGEIIIETGYLMALVQQPLT